MDLICNDVIIEKMAMWALRMYTVIPKMSFVCGFHDMGLLDNKGKGLVRVMWRCEIVPPDETRLNFWYQCKTMHICLVSTCKYVCHTLPLAAVCKF